MYVNRSSCSLVFPLVKFSFDRTVEIWHRLALTRWRQQRHDSWHCSEHMGVPNIAFYFYDNAKRFDNASIMQPTVSSSSDTFATDWPFLVASSVPRLTKSNRAISLVKRLFFNRIAWTSRCVALTGGRPRGLRAGRRETTRRSFYSSVLQNKYKCFCFGPQWKL